MRSICKALKEQVEDAQFYWRVSARYRKNRLRMRNFTGEHPHVIENVGCRCKICEGSIFKSQKRQDVDAIVHDRQAEKHLQVQRKASFRYLGLKNSICNSEYQGIADTSDTRKVNPSSLHLFQSRYTTKQEKDYAIQRIGVGLTRRS